MATEKEVSEWLLCQNESDSEDYLQHYGTPRHSGRYPWGSGDDPFQHEGDFLSRYNKLRESGLSDTQIAKMLNRKGELKGDGDYPISTTTLRALKSIANDERRKNQVAYARSLHQDGLSNVEIGKKMGERLGVGPIGESTIRSLLNEDREARTNLSMKAADNLEKIIKEKRIVDVGKSAEKQLGISSTKMNTVLEILKQRGYNVYSVKMPQVTNKGKWTTVRIICRPDVEYKETHDYGKIKSIVEYTSDDGGDTLRPSFVYPASLDSKRLAIRYKEDGGILKDGVIELRRGVRDLDLGGSVYSQVRILVDGTHYLKGMAVYSDDLPEGVDVLFNTNKSKDKSMHEVLKKIKDDPENPFGSAIKENGGQSYYIDPKTGEKKLSLINKRSDESDWNNWSNELSSQFLSKQPKQTIKRQINLAINDRVDEFNEIKNLTNPVIKKYLMDSFAEDCDSAAVHLKAASFPGQKYKVILPVPSLKDNEVYNPDLPDGLEVALIRYPHGGTFEIPILKVNNRNEEGKKYLGLQPADAIGINANVAERLSGADFDGDTVMCIPLRGDIKVNSTPRLKELVGFDPKLEYGPDPIKQVDEDGNEIYTRNGRKYRLISNTQKEMGVVSNLITDMTIKGAPFSEIAKAVKHSMVVIDADKHHLDYRASEIDNGIKQLKDKYQLHYDKLEGTQKHGASTLISMAKSEYSVPEKKEGAFFNKQTGKEMFVVDEDNEIYSDKDTGEIFTRKQVEKRYVDPKTGEKLFHETNKTYTNVHYKEKDGSSQVARVHIKDGVKYYKNKDGEIVLVKDTDKLEVKPALTKSTKMAEVKDAYTLSSGTPQEQLYAEYANRLKDLANKARLESLFAKKLESNPSAKKIYADQVEALNRSLDEAQLNAPRERQAQAIANANLSAIVKDNPSLMPEEKKKIEQRELSKARTLVGAKRHEIYITDDQWKAIQAGAISHSKLWEMLPFCDDKRLKQLAMPSGAPELSSSKINRIKSMQNAGYSTNEIAKTLNISSSTVMKYLKGGSK